MQDEETGQSYELELGKEVPYPERWGGVPDEKTNGEASPSNDAEVKSEKQGGKTTPTSANATPATTSTGRFSRRSSPRPTEQKSANEKSAAEEGGSSAKPSVGEDSTSNNNAQSTSSQGSPIRALRLPAIVRNRYSLGNSNSASTSARSNGTASRAPGEGLSEKATSASSGGSSSGGSLQNTSSNGLSQLMPGGLSRANRSSSSVSSAQLQVLNKQYHESLAASKAQSKASRNAQSKAGNARASVSRSMSASPSMRQSSRMAPTGSTEAAAEPANANLSLSGSADSEAQQSRQQQHYTAPARHYPIMSELPPSPPSDAEMESSADASPLARAGKAVSQQSQTQSQRDVRRPVLSAINTESVPPAQQQQRREYAQRQPSAASTSSTVYLSADDSNTPLADESVENDDPEDSSGLLTPTQKTVGGFGLVQDGEVLHSSPTKMTMDRIGGRPMSRSLSPTRGPRARTFSGGSGMLSTRAAAGPSSPQIGSGFLHPASAASTNQDSHHSSQLTPPRGQPVRRNTMESITGSLSDGSMKTRRPSTSGGIGLGGTVRRASKDRWMPGMSPADQLRQNSGDGASPPVQPTQLPASTSMSSGPLRTGDAGFDEEIARQEALIRKRKERARREEEEKASAAKESEAAADKPEPVIKPGISRAKSVLAKGPMSQLQGTGPGATAGATASGAPNGAAPAAAKEQDLEKAALVGNIINEGHVNYVLMYNMLTGIRIGVSRCQAKLKRPLRDEDYAAKHKFTFDIIGNELTPSAKYDFKFKDYAPWVFRELREYFYLDPADYLLSLTAKYILSELGSPGKSGSFFYFSRDYRFIIKTIRHSEHKFLRRILKDYHEHVKANPHTLLSRFYGLHRVKLPHGRKIHFVIMNNLFPPHRDIHETYDLKGSSFGREYPEERAREKKGATLKDINWIRRRRELELGPDKRGLFEAQLESDVALLKRLNIMDYSLLIGLHDMRKGNSENLRQEALQVVQPSKTTGAMTAKAAEAAPNALGATSSPPGVASNTINSPQSAPGDLVHEQGETILHTNGAAPPLVAPGKMNRRGSATTVGTSGDEEFFDAETGLLSPTSPTTGSAALPSTSPSKRATEKDAFALRAAVRRSDPKALGASSGVQLPARETSERRHFLFYQDEGGFRSTDEQNRPGHWIYYLGVIDLFTPYNSVKRGENWWKSLTQDARGISSVPPKQYGDRFVKFLSAIVRPLRWKDLPPGFDKVDEMKVD